MSLNLVLLPLLRPLGVRATLAIDRRGYYQVALVSEQTLANLLPALHERPDRVLLVASAEMARRGLDVRQRRLLAHFGIEAQVVPGAPDADLARIHEFALDLLGRPRSGRAA
jgi:hypothetical protein